MYPIMEVFTSIKGEGINTGIPMIFVRFAGCNMQCPFCDTPHERPAVSLTHDELVAVIERMDTLDGAFNWVVFTGGEPALHLTDALVAEMRGRGYKVAIETNGTLYCSAFDGVDHVAMSPKGSIAAEWWSRSKKIEEVRILVTSSDMAIDHLPNLHDLAEEVTFSPMFEGGHGNLTAVLRPDLLKRAIDLAIQNQGRVSVQVHKLIGVR